MSKRDLLDLLAFMVFESDETKTNLTLKQSHAAASHDHCFDCDRTLVRLESEMDGSAESISTNAEEHNAAAVAAQVNHPSQARFKIFTHESAGLTVVANGGLAGFG